MRIAILTFQWATNYGAILQTFALQKYLEKMGHEVWIVNYIPAQQKKTLLSCFKSKHIKKIFNNIKDLNKEKKLDNFRKKYFNYTDTLFGSYDDLRKFNWNYDLYISGSDQIWNKYFTLNGEGKITLSYFWDFLDEETKRISYATSLGFTNSTPTYELAIKDCLSKFSSISVREESAKKILEKISNRSVSVVPDPTILLDLNDYMNLLTSENGNYDYVFYMIHDNQRYINQLYKNLKKKKKIFLINNVSIEQWLYAIKNCKVFITNSYHGVIFSILFNINFFVYLIEGNNNQMNDRINNLLKKLKLQDRILTNVHDYYDKKHLKINWIVINKQIELIKNDGFLFLNDVFTKLKK